ncbi:hypothetical protein NPIL_220941 [Nephila pilipes]|uniref:Uncharacterized protein n=1 Tax=Nephila pilipes TaxID=299642 RepID=A0A8X6N8J9_NEPPI|nr:hypothetical protein NPIL_220941 [Nephila pilipes]
MVERSDSELFDLVAITDSVSTTNAKESGSFNTGEVAFAFAFVNNHNQLQFSDSLYVIKIIVNLSRDRILESALKSNHFSVRDDGTADNSRDKPLTLIIRLVIEELDIEEHFLGI